ECENRSDDPDLQSYAAQKDTLRRVFDIFGHFFDDSERAGSDRFRRPWAQLTTQFRMDPPIGQLISEAFYSGTLKSGTYDRNHTGLSAPLWIRGKPLVWLDTHALPHQDHPRWANRGEATLVADVVRALIREGDCVRQDLAVLSPYKDQLKLIRPEF